MAADVVLIGCTKTKRAERSAARDLYDPLMTQLALFPPPARAEQLHLFDPQEIRMPTTPTTTPARRGFLRRLLGLRPRWTPPSTTTDLTEADYDEVIEELDNDSPRFLSAPY